MIERESGIYILTNSLIKLAGADDKFQNIKLDRKLGRFFGVIDCSLFLKVITVIYRIFFLDI